MRRKNTRSARKSSPEKSKVDSPKRSHRQSSKRRRRSSSRSSYDSEDDVQTDIKESSQNEVSANPTSGQNSADDSKNYGELGDPARERQHARSKSSAGNETPEMKSAGYDRPYSPSHIPLDKDDNDDSQEKEEEKEEKNNKGKSKGKNKSNIEQSSNNIEPETENENVQGTPQSPSNDNADNENVQNVNDTLRSNSEEQEYKETENEIIHNENAQKNTELEINFESEYVHQNINQSIDNPEEERNQGNEPSQNNENSIVENQDNIIENKVKTTKESRYETNKNSSKRRSSSEKEERSSSKKYSSKRSSQEDRSTTPEPRIKEGSSSRNLTLESRAAQDYDKSRRKSSEENTKQKTEDGENSSKKKIILRRSPPENRESEKTEKSEQRSTHKERKSSTDDNKKEIEAQETKLGKKFKLRRPTVDERGSSINDENIDSKPEDQTSENSSDKGQLSSACEDKGQDIEEKPQRTLKPVKLIRNWSRDQKEDSEEKTNLATIRKRKWTTSDWLNKLTSSLCKIDVDSIKIVCPSLKFLGENEVHLESIPKERKTSERKVSVDNRSEDSDRPEYEKQTSEESGEIKIELNPNIIAMNRKISIVDDTASKLRPPPSPAKHPTSDVLFITNLVRPFTVKQLKELLERTGKIKEDGFWTDRIKSKCYVHYESVEEAEATRNALHGVHWPIGNGKKLVIDYAKVEDLEKAKNPAPAIITIPDKIPEKENREPVRAEEKYKDREDRDRKKRDGAVREWDLGKEDIRRGRTRSRSRSRERARKHSRRSFTPEDYVSKKQRKAEDSVPQKLMDDLFLKTKATPSIYWQPLSPEEIATKQMQRLVRMEEHKRRIEETRGRVRDNRRGPFRRR